jgi:hypothetical protein
MQIGVNYVQVHAHFPVLMKLMQSYIFTQKSQTLRNYITPYSMIGAVSSSANIQSSDKVGVSYIK